MGEFLILALLIGLGYLVLRPKRPPQPIDIPIRIIVTTEHRGDDSHDTQTDPDHDNWEGAFWDVQSPRNVEANLRIVYRDGAGSQTSRDIRLMKYGPWEGGAILWAYCRLRQANRTFRTDRIQSSTDLDTGEIIDNLGEWLDARYMASPEHALQEIVDTAWDALRVLYYVGKADGRLTQKERAIVRQAVRSMSDHPGIDDKRIDDMFDLIDIPTANSFKQAFGRLTNSNRALAEKVVVWSESMISTEKTVAATEREALEYLKTRLAKANSAEAQLSKE